MVVVLVLVFAATARGGGGGGGQRQQWRLIDSWPCHNHAGTRQGYMGGDDDCRRRRRRICAFDYARADVIIINELIDCSRGHNGLRTTTTTPGTRRQKKWSTPPVAPPPPSSSSARVRVYCFCILFFLTALTTCAALWFVPRVAPSMVLLRVSCPAGRPS